MAVPVTLGGIDFNTGRGPDGVEWSLDITAGWDAPELRQEFLDQLVDGSAMGAFGRRHRTIVCEGVMHALSDEAHWTAYDRLTSLVGLTTPRAFTVGEPTGAKTVSVLTGAGSPRIRTINGRVFEFQLTLVALDPRKYGVTTYEHDIAPGSGVTLEVGGTTATPLSIRVGGSGGRMLVRHNVAGVSTYTLGGPFSAGSVIDAGERTARASNGSSLFGRLDPEFDWIYLSPGRTQAIHNTGDSVVTISYRDAWI